MCPPVPFPNASGAAPLLVAGPALMALSAIIAALSTNFTIFMISRFVLGVGSAIAMTIIMTAIADLSTSENRGRAMALAQGAALSGWSIGPSIGGFAAVFGGYPAPFWLQGALMAAAAITIQLFQAETLSRDQAAKAKAHPGFLHMFRSLGFVAACVVTFSIFFDRTALSQYLMPLAGELVYGIDAGKIGIAMTLIAVGNASVLVVIGSLIDRFGAMRWLIVGGIITASGLILFAAGQSVTAYLIASVIVGIGTGFTGPASSAFAADKAPPGQMGAALGVVRMIGDSAFVIGPALMALIVATPGLGIRAGFVLAALLGLGSVATAAFLVRRR